MLHRTRQLLVRQRTMLSNALRGHLAELGIVSAKGRNGTAELLELSRMVLIAEFPRRSAAFSRYWCGSMVLSGPR
jgi:transposase